MRCRYVTLPMILLLASAPLSAAMITATSFTQSAYNNALSGYTILAGEDFEDFSVGNLSDGFSTNVGTFSSAGGVGTGGSVIDNGSFLAVREGNVFGRSSTTPTLSNDVQDDHFLDSNDTYGIEWEAYAGGSLFDRLVLTITDADEFANMIIEVAGMSLSLENSGNAVSLLLQIDLNTSVTSQKVYFRNFNQNNELVNNDGFSLDDIAVASVPLPGSVFLLLGALASLGFIRRRN